MQQLIIILIIVCLCEKKLRIIEDRPDNFLNLSDKTLELGQNLLGGHDSQLSKLNILWFLKYFQPPEKNYPKKQTLLKVLFPVHQNSRNVLRFDLVKNKKALPFVQRHAETTVQGE